MAPKKGSKTTFKKLMEKYQSKINRSRVPTGIVIFDAILGGGIPNGTMIEMHSQSGCGKSTLLLHACKNLIKFHDYTILYVDAENAIREIVDSMGLQEYIDAGKLIIVDEVNTYGQLDELTKSVIEDPDSPVNMMVIDSITSIGADVLMEEDITKAEVASDAKLLARYLKKYKAKLKAKNIVMFLINQVRDNLNAIGMFAEKTKASGGKALEFYPDIRVEIKSGTKLKRKEERLDGTIDETPYGMTTKIGCIKNKTARPFIFLEMPIIFGVGVSNIQTLATILQRKGYVRTQGSYLKTSLLAESGKEHSFQGSGRYGEWVKANYEELYKILEADGVFDVGKGNDGDPDDYTSDGSGSDDE